MNDQLNLIDLTADIVSAFVSNNVARAADLPEIISTVHASLADIMAPKPAAAPAQPRTPAVPVRKSITDDYLVCLDDGKKFKSLRRHLASLGMTPEDYRAKWGLPHDYPMVAPGYAATRSELAKAAGLGRKAQPAPVPSKPTAPAHDPLPTLIPVVRDETVETPKRKAAAKSAKPADVAKAEPAAKQPSPEPQAKPRKRASKKAA